MFIVRQGDVMVIGIAKLPESLVPVPRDGGKVVLAYGEVTGHSHAIADCDVEMFSAADTEDRFLRVMSASGVELRHDEHATITLPAGFYIARRQREYTSHDMEPIKVAD